MGIKVQRIRPYQPTDNAKVERMQGVTYRWAEPHQCNSIEQLNRALEEACFINRERYPCDHLKGKTRIEAYPRLLKGGTSYTSNDFDLNRILTFLAKGIWVRKTSPKGVISFFSQYWNLTTKYKRQQVFVHLDQEMNEWVVSIEHAEIKRFPNNFITEESITGFEFGKHK